MGIPFLSVLPSSRRLMVHISDQDLWLASSDRTTLQILPKNPRGFTYHSQTFRVSFLVNALFETVPYLVDAGNCGQLLAT